MVSVLFATKCWEQDWKKMISGSFERKWKACEYSFDKKVLVLNNGVPEGVEGFMAKQTGNVYADGELGAVEAAKDFEYMVFIQGDCQTQGGDWITPGIKVLESEPDVLLVSPASEVNTRGEYDMYCSDQAFICRVSDLNKPEVYSYRTIDPDYPSYAGLSFEHLVGNYMKATGKKRKILNDFWVHHGIS